MGLTHSSSLADMRVRDTAGERTVALAGNPNVGKSTIFNALTGLNQHTGNWSGKTVSIAAGVMRTAKHTCRLVDVPGAYSLLAHSPEEEVARDFVCFGEEGAQADAVVVVCDATCLERNLNLVLQTIEVGRPVLVCVNLLDEAAKRGIVIDLLRLRRDLGVPVVGVTAREPQSLTALTGELDKLLDGLSTTECLPPVSPNIPYPAELSVAAERLAAILPPLLKLPLQSAPSAYWLALRLLEGEPAMQERIERWSGVRLEENSGLQVALGWARDLAESAKPQGEELSDAIVGALVARAEEIATAVTSRQKDERGCGEIVDRILTGRYTAYPVMLLLLMGVFWLTIVGANYPSEALSALFAWVGVWLNDALCGLPPWLHGLLLDGVYRTVSWVVSVMLPPMAIFFPLFTLLEDVGYLPRVAYNLDKPFARCHACGKQALTMTMGFGCNAAGVVGCRIIDSPRERLLAILTNSFVPCNGRFPTLISLLLMFFVGAVGGWAAGLQAAVMLTGLILLSIGATLAVTRLLSDTVLKGEASAFALELPPYRRPQIISTLVRSLLDRTIFVLGRAIVAAAPAGALIWLLANLSVGDVTLLARLSGWLELPGRLLGLDGVILLSFILGLPANEIVVPIMLMCYLSAGTLVDVSGIADMKLLLAANGWTEGTAVCTLIFMLFHSPCATTLLTVRRETDSLRWTVLAALLPTAVGIGLCAVINLLAAILQDLL